MPDDPETRPVKLKSLEIKVKPRRDFDFKGWEDFTPAPGAKSYRMRDNAPASLFLSALQKIEDAWKKGENFITVSVDGDGFIAPDPRSGASGRRDSAVTGIAAEHDAPSAADVEARRSKIKRVRKSAPSKKPPKKPKGG